jgi:hypothetical protein
LNEALKIKPSEERYFRELANIRRLNADRIKLKEQQL